MFWGKNRSIGRRPFPKAKFFYFMFKVVFKNLLKWRHLNKDPFICDSSIRNTVPTGNLPTFDKQIILLIDLLTK